jgi:ketosteroid isomerase-like protein
MRITAQFAVLLAVLTLASFGTGAATPPTQGTVDVQKLLDDQVAAWNRADLEGYMAGYWKSPGLTFFSNANESHGWGQTLEHYRQKYKQNKNGMGKLALAVNLEQVDEKTVLGRGEWRLTMPDGSTPHGLTTLIVRKLPEGWRIVHDHSSSAQ